jgi:hypothetical protein
VDAKRPDALAAQRHRHQRYEAQRGNACRM